MPTQVRLLGRPRLEVGGQPCRQPRGFKSWAVLARVVLSERPVSRQQLAEELFPDADDPRGALRWSMADLRAATGVAGCLRGDPVAVEGDELWLDTQALLEGNLPTEDIGGRLLEGVELDSCPQFMTWLLLARAQCERRSREELRERALRLMATGDLHSAIAAAGRAARLSPLDDGAQELFLRALVAAGQDAQATAHLASCSATFAREGLVPSPALREAARSADRPRSRVAAGVAASALLGAGKAALSAGVADAGVEALRRAADEAASAGDARLETACLAALGGALVHAVRGYDGEGAVVLHRALLSAQQTHDHATASEVHRELAFVDLQAGRHATASRALTVARREAVAAGDDSLVAWVDAIDGMNEADTGRHDRAAQLLGAAADAAGRLGETRQQAWSLGVLARSLLLAGHLQEGFEAADASIALAQQDHWNAFLPWPQVLRAQALVARAELKAARYDAESAFALGCELGDPCWEGMAARAIGMLAAQDGDLDAAHTWIVDARRRSDRVPDRYVWVSAYIGLAELELAVRRGGDHTAAEAARLYDDAHSADLPEFQAWALVHEAESGDGRRLALGGRVAEGVVNPALHARISALSRRGEMRAVVARQA